MVALSNI